MSAGVGKSSEAQLAASEIRFLLPRPEISLTAVEAAVSKMHGLRAELEMLRIRSALEAIGKIGLPQHRKAIATGKDSAPH